MMRPELPVGVIGCGAIAAVHLRVLQALPGVRVTALADPSAEALARAGQLIRGAALSDSAEELLARNDLAAVVVAAPSGLHAPIALTTLNTGRHIYLEKPIATTLEDGRRVADAARGAAVVAAIGFNWRYQPLIVRARELLRTGVIGDIRAVNTQFCEPAAARGWRARRHEGGGVLLDLGSHHFDLVRWLLNARVERVEAEVESQQNEQDVARVRLHLDSGTLVSSVFSLCAAKAHSLELIGERGVMKVNRITRTLSLTGVRARTTTIASLAWRLRSIVRPRSEPSWRNALRAFVARVRGEIVELPTFDDGLRSLEIVAAAERAAGVD